MSWDAHLIRLTARVRDTFRVPVVYRPTGGGEHALQGVFDEAYEATRLDDEGAAVDLTQPVLGLRRADLVALGITPRVRDRAVIAGRTWEVTGGTRDDGSGWFNLTVVET